MHALQGQRRLHAYRVPAAALAAGAAVTALTAFTPYVNFAYRSPSVHLVLETVGAMAALLAAYLLFGRFRATRRATDLALIYPLALFAANNVFLSFVIVASAESPSPMEAWMPPLVRLVAAATLAAAAFVPPRTVLSPVGAARFVTAAALATLSLIALCLAFLGGFLPNVDHELVLSAVSPALTGHPLLLATFAAAALLFALAAVGFARAAVRDDDELMVWFSGGAVLAAFASVHYLLFPTRYSDLVYTGDVLRIGFYLLLLAGAFREFERYWEERARAAVLEERRRLARDLHDGLAQELAFIWRQSRKLAAGQNGPVVSALSGAVERALHESRRAVAALRAQPTQSLAAALTEALDAVAARVSTRVVVDVDGDVDVTPETREQLLRIACEAVANAGRHGRAQLVRVDFFGGEAPRLIVVDDGEGFDTGAPPRQATFGLVSMRERARALDGRLSISSRPGGGTRVEVQLP